MTNHRTTHEQVLEFYHAFQQDAHIPPAGTAPSLGQDTIPEARLHLKMALIAEEFIELVEAVYGSASAAVLQRAWADARGLDDGTRDVVEAADATADLRYVLEGFDIETNIPSLEVFQEVHASNLSKLDGDGNPIISDGTDKPRGKILKGPHFFEPNVAGVLAGEAPRGRP